MTIFAVKNDFAAGSLMSRKVSATNVFFVSNEKPFSCCLLLLLCCLIVFIRIIPFFRGKIQNLGFDSSGLAGLWPHFWDKIFIFFFNLMSVPVFTVFTPPPPPLSLTWRSHSVTVKR